MDSSEEDESILLQRADNENDVPVEPGVNPIRLFLMHQLREIREKTNETKDEIRKVTELAEQSLRRFRSIVTYGEEDSSESDSELYTAEGDRIFRKNASDPEEMRGFTRKRQPLVICDTWQRILCEKWILGFILSNRTRGTLKSIVLYLQGPEHSDLDYSFSCWRFQNQFWDTVDEVPAKSNHVVLAAVLDLAILGDRSILDLHGTISYEFEDKTCQSVLPKIQLKASDVTGKDAPVDFSSGGSRTDVLVLKAIAVERNIIVPLQNDRARGRNLQNFLREMGFEELEAMTDNYVSKSCGALGCVLVELILLNSDSASLRISTSSMAQMNVILSLFREKFPDADFLEDKEHDKNAALVLAEEIQSRIENADEFRLKMAKIKTELFIR